MNRGTKRARTQPIGKLPIELLIRILALLESTYWLRIIEVNTTFKDLVGSNFKLTLTRTQSAEYIFSGIVPPFTVGALKLTGYDNLKGINSTVAIKCVSLHTLDLSGCKALTDISALGGCGSLHKLDLSGCKALTDISALGGCGSLHTLNLSSCRNLSNITGLGGCGSLYTLYLSFCRKLRKITGLSGCGSLHTLNLNHCHALDNISELSEYGSLHTLNLNRCRKLRKITGLSGCGSLHTLDLSKEVALENIPTLMACNSLAKLVLQDEHGEWTTFQTREQLECFYLNPIRYLRLLGAYGCHVDEL